MKLLFENWRKFRNESLTEKRAGPLVYATNASAAAGFGKARELDKERKTDQKRAMEEAMAVIEANRPNHPILSEVTEELIQKISILIAQGVAISKIPYILSEKVSGSTTLRGGRFGGRRAMRRLLQKVLTRWVPILGWALLTKDIYDYFLSVGAGENREALIQDFNMIVDSMPSTRHPTAFTSPAI